MSLKNSGQLIVLIKQMRAMLISIGCNIIRLLSALTLF